MSVEIRCPGRTPFMDKINAAYATCGPQGSLQTVRALTGVQINYLITVNFRGFRQIVDRLGGAWIDVDRRYFNDRGGPGGYARINLFPGYQRLDGRQTLDYVRYRHTDSDLYRVARQQQFVKAFKGQIQESFAPTALPKVVNAITHNVEVAQGGGVDVDGRTVLSYALFAYGLPRGRVFQTRIEGLEGVYDLTTDSSNVTRAVTTFTHPDVESSENATAVALGEKVKRRAPAPSATTITVLNGNGVDGSASTAGYLLGQRGYQVLDAAERAPRECPQLGLLPDRGQLRRAQTRRERGGAEGGEPLRLRGGEAAARADLAARERRDAHGRRRPDVPRQPRLRSDRPDAEARAPEHLVRAERVDRPAPRAPRARPVPAHGSDGDRAQLVDGLDDARAHVLDRPGREAQGRARSSTAWGRTSTGASQMTDWDDAPVLADKSLTRRIGGRVYDLYYNGPKLHMVVLNTPKARYWVVNTLLDRISNETMLAIAKGLKPLGSVKRR